MEFTLVYRGPLEAMRPNRRSEKQTLRRYFHAQLKELWNQPPLNDSRQMWDPLYKHYEATGDLRQRVGAFEFAPLVCEKTSLVADLEIDLLRPGPFGLSGSHAGDIDNRLKVLLDALRMPQDASELPDDAKPSDGETPFFCVLQDDSLIHDLNVRTHRWTEPDARAPSVNLLIKIRTLLIRDRFDGANLGSWMV